MDGSNYVIDCFCRKILHYTPPENIALYKTLFKLTKLSDDKSQRVDMYTSM